jgi:hypothetical protein
MSQPSPNLEGYEFLKETFSANRLQTEANLEDYENRLARGEIQW